MWSSRLSTLAELNDWNHCADFVKDGTLRLRSTDGKLVTSMIGIHTLVNSSMIKNRTLSYICYGIDDAGTIGVSINLAETGSINAQGTDSVEYLIGIPHLTASSSSLITILTTSKKGTPSTTKSTSTVKQYLKRWMGWGSKKAHPPKPAPAPPSFNEALPLSSCTDEAIYDDASSSCPLIPKPYGGCQRASASTMLSESISTGSSLSSRIMESDINADSDMTDGSPSNDATTPLPPPSLSLDESPILMDHTVAQAACDAPSDRSSFSTPVLDTNQEVDMKSDVVEPQDSKYLVYEWPSDDDDNECGGATSWTNQPTTLYTTTTTDQPDTPTRPPSLVSMNKSTSCYFDCCFSSLHIPTDLGSNTSFFTTNSSLSTITGDDDDDTILDRDALLLVTYGVDFLKQRENTNWEEDLPSSPSASSGLTLVPLESGNVTSLVPEKTTTTSAQDDEVELRRLVSTHILF